MMSVYREGKNLASHIDHTLLRADVVARDIETLCAEALDLTGDARDEIVLWDLERMWIYIQDKPFQGDRIYRPVRYPHYNASDYRAEISLPGWDKT